MLSFHSSLKLSFPVAEKKKIILSSLVMQFLPQISFLVI